MLSRCGALWDMSGTYHHTRTMLNRVYPHGKGRTDDDRRAGRIAIRVSRPPGFQVTVAIFSASVVSVPLGAGNGGPRRLDSRRRGRSRDAAMINGPAAQIAPAITRPCGRWHLSRMHRLGRRRCAGQIAEL